MKVIHILYGQFYDHNGKKLLIGGVETYIRNLSILFSNNGYKVNIYQYANREFNISLDFANIYGVVPDRKKEIKNYNCYKSLVSFAEKNGDCKNDILIFGSDLGIVKTAFKYVIAIQHGIGWDIQLDYSVNQFKKIKYFIRNCRIAIEKKKKYNFCNKVVCVDYNFVNWYRTLIVDEMSKIYTITNFTKIPPKLEKRKNSKLTILFARRFQKYRGTMIFADAIKKIFEDGYDIEVVFAGEGPEEEYLKERFKNNNQVTFTKFHPDESIEFHRKFDIAIVPSIGSEGTSLSLLEAMAASCAVIVTDVGGLTNIILDNYNGIIVRPQSDAIYEALKRLMNNDYRKILSQNAYDTVSKSFSYEKWCNSWLEVLKY